jgi:non-haem Fe2+, alpha-ketoglutarate-dependent halogenase
MAAGLNAAQCAAYAADGFVAPLEVLSPAEAAACQAQLAAVLRADGTADVRVRNKPHLLFRWAADLVQHPRILDAVSALLGSDLLVRQAVVFAKGTGDPGYVDWHQDAAYWDVDSDRVVTAWIALTDSEAANGAVRVVPGSHRGPRLAHGLTADPRGRLLRGQCVASDAAPPLAEAACITLRAGQFSLHHPWLLHGSPANSSRLPRVGLAVRYFAPDVRQAGPRQNALLARGTDRYGYYAHECAARFDGDPEAGRWHSRNLRRYAAQVIWQVARRPTRAHLRLLGRLALRRELVRAFTSRRTV